jgi:hypothetical protein
MQHREWHGDSALPAVGVALAISGDQFYPATNGNNLYFGTGSQVAWVGNASAGPAGQTLTVTYVNEAGIAPAPNPALAAVTAMGVDGNRSGQSCGLLG